MTADQLIAENRALRSLLGDIHDYLEDCADVNRASIREFLDAKESA